MLPMLMVWEVLLFLGRVPFLRVQLLKLFGHGHKGEPWWCEISQPCKQGIEGTHQTQGRHSGREAICRCKASSTDGHRE